MTINNNQSPAAFLATLLLTFTTGVTANPVGEQVIQGQAGFARNGSNLIITQGSQRVIINWQDFSNANGELTKFIQPNNSSAALNRVVSGNLSSLLGDLEANGHVYLINPNGIVVGADANINTQSFIASTLDVADADFMNGGDLNFVGDSQKTIENLGTINGGNGDVFLIAKHVDNSGTIKAEGHAGLAGGNDVLLKASGDDRLAVRVTDKDGRVDQKGLVEATKIELRTAGNNPYALAINHEGISRATSAVNKKGRIILFAEGGTAKADGTFDASAPDGGDGGFIETSGTHVEIANTINVDTSARNGVTGTWLIDPEDIEINSVSTIGGASLINASTIEGNLENTHVTITSNNALGGNGDITVNESIISVSTNNLTMNAGAGGDVTVNQSIDVGGDLALNAGNGASGSAGSDANAFSSLAATNGQDGQRGGFVQVDAELTAANVTLRGGRGGNGGDGGRALTNPGVTHYPNQSSMARGGEAGQGGAGGMVSVNAEISATGNLDIQSGGGGSGGDGGYSSKYFGPSGDLQGAPNGADGGDAGAAGLVEINNTINADYLQLVAGAGGTGGKGGYTDGVDVGGTPTRGLGGDGGSGGLVVINTSQLNLNSALIQAGSGSQGGVNGDITSDGAFNGGNGSSSGSSGELILQQNLTINGTGDFVLRSFSGQPGRPGLSGYLGGSDGIDGSPGANGNIWLGAYSINTAGNLDLQSGGDITGSGLLTANDISLNANTLNAAIGSTGAGAIQTNATGVISATASNGAGGIYLSKQGDVNLSNIALDSGTGDTELTAVSGGITSDTSTFNFSGANLTLTTTEATDNNTPGDRNISIGAGGISAANSNLVLTSADDVIVDGAIDAASFVATAGDGIAGTAGADGVGTGTSGLVGTDGEAGGSITISGAISSSSSGQISLHTGNGGQGGNGGDAGISSAGSLDAPGQGGQGGMGGDGGMLTLNADLNTGGGLNISTGIGAAAGATGQSAVGTMADNMKGADGVAGAMGGAGGSLLDNTQLLGQISSGVYSSHSIVLGNGGAGGQGGNAGESRSTNDSAAGGNGGAGGQGGAGGSLTSDATALAGVVVSVGAGGTGGIGGNGGDSRGISDGSGQELVYGGEGGRGGTGGTGGALTLLQPILNNGDINLFSSGNGGNGGQGGTRGKSNDRRVIAGGQGGTGATGGPGGNAGAINLNPLTSTTGDVSINFGISGSGGKGGTGGRGGDGSMGGGAPGAGGVGGRGGTGGASGSTDTLSLIDVVAFGDVNINSTDGLAGTGGEAGLGGQNTSTLVTASSGSTGSAGSVTQDPLVIRNLSENMSITAQTGSINTNDLIIDSGAGSFSLEVGQGNLNPVSVTAGDINLLTSGLNSSIGTMADRLTLQATGLISLAANNGNGGIYVEHLGDTYLNSSVLAGSGDFDITSGGGLSTGADFQLTAANFTLASSGDIQINTNLDLPALNMSATASGAIQINEDISIASLSATSGSNGDILVDGIITTLAASVDLIAGASGSILVNQSINSAGAITIRAGNGSAGGNGGSVTLNQRIDAVGDISIHTGDGGNGNNGSHSACHLYGVCTSPPITNLSAQKGGSGGDGGHLILNAGLSSSNGNIDLDADSSGGLVGSDGIGAIVTGPDPTAGVAGFISGSLIEVTANNGSINISGAINAESGSDVSLLAGTEVGQLLTFTTPQDFSLTGSSNLTLQGYGFSTSNNFSTENGDITINSGAGDLTLNSGAALSSTGSGNILFVSEADFHNDSGTNAPFSLGSGRFVVYSTRPDDNRNDIGTDTNAIAHDFVQYGGSFDSSDLIPAFLPAGNGFVYSVQPVLTGVTVTVNNQTIDYGQNINLADFSLDASAPASYEVDSSAIAIADFELSVPPSISVGDITLALDSSVGYGTSGFAQAGSYTGGIEAVFVSGTSNGLSLNGSADLTVNTIDLNVSLAADNRVYDATSDATVSISSDDRVAGDMLLIDAGTSSFADKNVGTDKLVTVAGVSLSGDDAANYNLIITNSGSLSADISAADLVVNGAVATNRIYDGTTDASVAGGSVTALLSDVVSLSAPSATFADKNVGTDKAITTAYTLSGTDAGNYNLVQPVGLTADISQRTLNATLTANDKTYDTTVAATGTFGDDRIAGDVFAISGTSNFDTKDAGTNKTVTATGLSLSGTDAGNYVLASTSANDLADITQAALNITANDDSKVFDGTAYSGGNAVSYAGFVGGENQSILTGTTSFSGTSQGAINPGSYVITPGGLSSGNYAITFLDGGLTINAATIGGTGSGGSSTSGGNGPNGIFNGFQSQQNNNVNIPNPSGNFVPPGSGGGAQFPLRQGINNGSPPFSTLSWVASRNFQTGGNNNDEDDE